MRAAAVRLLRGVADLGPALAALGAVALLLVPAPPWLLDLAIAANLALAAVVLGVALLARDPLAFTAFPTVLLFTTLFRLAVAVAATRLVLTRGDAGRVIRAFGEVVAGGSALVGGVVYAILTLAQLLVVARGAERVAEVAARFALDALPGQQLSIDAELRSGALDAAEAARRRRALEREGQLHGALDGALKFVKGDALAGLAIVLVNLLGGLAAGLARGLSPGEAARRYALLAMGDGLAAQVPALLISLAAGAVVTRVAGEVEGEPLARDLGRQLLGDARPLLAVAGLLAALALWPGLPAAPFAGLAALAALAARRGGVPRGELPAPGPAAQRRGEAEASPLVLEVAGDLAALAGAAGGRLVGELLPAVRAELARELGVRLPPVTLRAGDGARGRWRLLLDEVPAASGLAPVDEVVALCSAGELAAVGLAAVAGADPLTGRPVARVAAADRARAAALAPVRGPLEQVAAAVAAALRAHAHLLVGIQEVQELLDGLEGSHPALVREAARQLAPAVLADVLRRLLEEGIPARPLPAVIEALLEQGPGRPPEALAEGARRALRRQIAHRHAGAGVLPALLLDAGAERALREAAEGAGAPPPARGLQELLAAIGEVAARAAERGEGHPPVLLAPPELRRLLRQLVAPRYPGLAVLSYDDLPPALPVRSLGTVGLGPAEDG